MNIKKIKRGERTFGSWITIGNPIVTELMAKSGFDWLTIDMEHSAITLPIAQDMIRIIELSGCVPLVRVGTNDSVLIKRVLDAGAYGIIVPMINTKKDAEQAVKAAYYPPTGARGVGLARAQNYGFGFEEYKKRAAKELLVIAQIEHIEAIKNLSEILTVKGIDGTIIGPYDLSASMGHPGEFNNSKVLKALKQYREICLKFEKTMGYHVIPPESKEISQKILEGYTFLAFSLDTMFLGNKIRDEMEKIHNID